MVKAAEKISVDKQQKRKALDEKEIAMARAIM